MQYCELGNIYATDLPRREAWLKISSCELQFNPEIMTLNELGIVIAMGTAFPVAVRDGHHRLSRLLQMFGPQQVVAYEPVAKNPDAVDEDVEINAQCGIETINDFLAMCLLQKFIGGK